MPFDTQKIIIDSLEGWIQISKFFQVVKKVNNYLLNIILFSISFILITVTLATLFLTDTPLSLIDHLIRKHYFYCLFTKTRELMII